MASNIAEDEFNQIAKKSAKNLAQEKDQQKELNPNFFSNNKTSPLNTPLKNPIPKKTMQKKKRSENDVLQKRFSNTRIKTRSYLTNTAHSRLNKHDFTNSAFICNAFILLAQNMNTFLLERKFTNVCH